MQAQGYDPAKHYTQDEVDALVQKSPYYKATSNDVDWLMKVKMQGRIQKWVDHSISVTINLPNDVDEELVNRLYVEAWKSGCKGCTTFDTSIFSMEKMRMINRVKTKISKRITEYFCSTTYCKISTSRSCIIFGNSVDVQFAFGKPFTVYLSPCYAAWWQADAPTTRMNWKASNTATYSSSSTSHRPIHKKRKPGRMRCLPAPPGWTS